MINKKLLYPICITFLFFSCGERSKQAMRLIYAENAEVEALIEVPNIQFDSLQTSALKEDVKQFYKSNNYHLGWSDTSNRKQLIESINELKFDGITIKQQEINQLVKLDSIYDQLQESEKIEADFLFSTMYVNTLDKLYNGSINAKRLYGDWEITSKPLNTSATMLVALENNNIAISYDSIRTKQPLYTQLRQKLSSYYALEKDSLKPFNHGKLNDTIPELIAVKKHLIFLNQLADSIESNAIYTTATAQSIKDFQTKKKLKSTGYADEGSSQGKRSSNFIQGTFQFNE